jgi:murein DD-endopeptidase MepM/ murein hydrolase activator NlpD
MQKIKILTFLTLTLLWGFTTRADFQMYDNPNFLIAAQKIKIYKEGVLVGENNSNTWSGIFNGLYHSSDLYLSMQKKVLEGARITDIETDNDSIYVTTYMNLNGKIGLFKISKDFQKVENIGIKYTLNVVLPFKDKIYYGGNNFGAYVVEKSGSGNKQLLGTGVYGPQIDQLKKNSTNVFVLSRGNLYVADYNTNSLAQLFPIYRPSNIEPTDSEIFATSYNKFVIFDLKGNLKYEKSFTNPLGIMKKYLNYIFIVENTSTEQKIWVSNDYGKNFYETKLKYGKTYRISQIEATGTDTLTIYINLQNYGILKGKFKFDFEEKPFLGFPFIANSEKDLLDKITSYFDHRFPLLGNHTESSEFSTTTLNFNGQELSQPYLYYSSHDGIDFGLPLNSKILSVEKGVATYFYQSAGLGHAIMVSHPNGYISVYGHMSPDDLVTKSSVNVDKGEVIGKVGMSGNTTGPHLHFTLYKGLRELQNKVDPFGWRGNFIDPWTTYSFISSSKTVSGAKSSYLWEYQNPIYNLQINLNDINIFADENIGLTLENVKDSNTYHLKSYRNSPLYNLNNYKYIPNTSYNFEVTDLENNKTLIFGNIKYSNFTSFADEKRFSIFKNDGTTISKLETIFYPDSSTLGVNTTLDGQFMVLENKYKKITSTSSFITQK